jgi:hypothetical protein
MVAINEWGGKGKMCVLLSRDGIKQNVQRIILIGISLGIFGLAAACLHLTKGKTKTEIFIDTTYKTLASSAIAYNNTMKALNELYQKGYIDDTTKREIDKIDNAYRIAYHTAVDLLEQFIISEDPDVRANLESELNNMENHLDDLDNYLTQGE